ncbi:DUF1631 family protein [Cognatilysobacter lacus]|uniref:DUF1631 domain-containing protein n=1 Tax=Cognatilysobacter lacus TaxID=1643323 RepID=A0A5D8Z9L7_9GAMM|nr:DUF1631 family protein [Lysobacter lacus]TZF90753.1 DUF1631 domain-containing protein [Lysobacter lacus]
MINQFPEQGIDPRLDPSRVLEALKRLSVERMGTFPTVLYIGAEREFAETGPDAYHELAGLNVLRARNASDTMTFRQQIAQGFDEFRNPFIRAGVALGLIDEDMIDLHLQAQALTEILDKRYQTQLLALRTQMEELALAMRVPTGANPVSPSRLCATLVSSIGGSGVSEPLGRVLFRQFQQQLVPILDALYPNLGAVLNRAGYGVNAWAPAAIAKFEREEPEAVAPVAKAPQLPEQAFTPQQQVYPPQAPLYPQSAPFAPAPSPLARSVGDGTGSHRHSTELEPLREQLRLWRMERQHGGVRSLSQAPVGLQYGVPGFPVSAGMAGPGGHAAPTMREFQAREISSIASVLQAEPPDVFARALGTTGKLAEAMRGYLAEGARRLGLHPEYTALSANDEDAVDMVALLFESLFRTHALQERARRVYARLVLPYLKVAINDDSMFVERGHPARRLLDALTEACEDNNGSTPQERELLERASAVSQRIVAEFNEDVSVFEMAYAELEDLLSQQRRRVELQEQRAAKASYGRERLAQARTRADVVLQRRLAQTPLTQAVGDFLTTPWRHHLVQTLLRDGEDSVRFRDAIAMGDALADADGLASRAMGDALVRQLLSLEEPLTECLASSGLDATAASHGLAGIVRGLADPDVSRRVRPMPPPVRDEPEQESRLWLAGGTDTVRADPLWVGKIRALEVGSWLRLSDAQGEPISAKVAWVSPLTSRLLLVNRRGMRVLAASIDELAVLGAEGRLAIATGQSPFEAAMEQLQQQIRTAA